MDAHTPLSLDGAANKVFGVGTREELQRATVRQEAATLQISLKVEISAEERARLVKGLVKALR
jgi:hypothetical protein